MTADSPKPLKTMKIRITKDNQHDLMGFMRMFRHAMTFAGVHKTVQNNVMSLFNGAIGEDSIGEFILVPLPPKQEETTDQTDDQDGFPVGVGPTTSQATALKQMETDK